MNHNSDKVFFEYLIKNMLQHYNFIENDFKKSEKPDFKNNTIGLEVTRADQTLAFDGYVSKNKKEDIKNISKFNNNFKKLGGCVLKKTDPIVKILNLHDTFHYNEDYLYIPPSYQNTFDFLNKMINSKLKKLNSIYDDNLECYYLGIFTPILVSENNIQNELYTIIKIQSNYNKYFKKIIIIFIDKICEFNLQKNTYKIINNTNEVLNSISIKTSDELKNNN